MAPNTNTNRLPTGYNKEIGRSGTLIYKGFISGEEYNRHLQGRFALEQFDIMGSSDSTVHATLQVCKLPIVAANVKVNPASKDPADIDRAVFSSRELFDRNITFTDVLYEALTCLDFGHSLFEIVYGPTTWNGQFRWGLEKLASRKQRSILRWEMSNGKPGVTQVLPIGEPRDIPMEKLIPFINERRGENYDGRSLLRYAYKHWKIKDSLEIMNAVALERGSVGVPVVRDKDNVDPPAAPDLENLYAALRQFRANEESFLREPKGVSLEMMDMKQSSLKDILPTLQYEDSQIMLSVLAQFLGLGMNGRSGSRALSSDHSSLFIRSLQAVARIMQQGFQTLINRLEDINYSDLPNGHSKIAFTDLSDENVADISTALSNLVTAGVITPGMDVENRARKMLDIQELTEQDYQQKQDEKLKQQQQMAEQQAKNQPSDANTNNPKNGPKGKQKADALSAAKIAQANLMNMIAEV